MKKWFRLDTAGLIFPAVMNKKWSNAFRLTATLTEEVDVAVLQQALNDLKKRFPTFYVRLAPGIFWYRLEETEKAPAVTEDYAYPLVHMSQKDLEKQCMRVLVYKKRIAIELFHSVTDGNGGLFFLSNLLRQYIALKYGVKTEDSAEMLSLSDPVEEAETEDSFFLHTSDYASNDKECATFHVTGEALPKKTRKLIVGTVDSSLLCERAHFYHTTVTVYLASLMEKVLLELQAEQKPIAKQKPVKITIPVNLRKLYGSKTLRNFVLTLNIGVDPRQGEYSLPDLCETMHHQLKAKATKQYMAGMMAQNILPQRITAVKLAPLPLKNLIMRIVYAYRGEKAGSINISNLGKHTLPDSMKQFVDGIDFIIGPQKDYPNNCSVITYGEKTRICMIRSIKETDLERRFFSALVEEGIPVEIESN